MLQDFYYKIGSCYNVTICEILLQNTAFITKHFPKNLFCWKSNPLVYTDWFVNNTSFGI